MQSQEFHETFEENRVCKDSDTKNGTPTITGKDTCLINNIIRSNSKQSFRGPYNFIFHVYVCRVNKCKPNCNCSSRREALSENIEKLYKDCNFWNNDDCSQSQNGKAKIKKNFYNTWGLKGLITNKQGKETKYSCRAKTLPTWCENVTILNNNPTGNRIPEPRLSPVPSNENDNLAINEISNLLTYLKAVGGENCKKTENWPHVYIPILEKCLHCEKEMALDRIRKMRNHRNISTKIDPEVDMFLTQPRKICKKNKYMKGFCGRLFLRQDGSTSKSFCSKKEKNTNTYITCFEKLPLKSCVLPKKMTFTPNKRVCKKTCSLNDNCNYVTVPKDGERNQTPCKKPLFMDNMNKFLALNTLLEEKTVAEKAEILKCLANNGVSLPAAKTKSEKKIFNKVQKELKTMCKKPDKQQCNDYSKSMKVDFLKPFRCKSYNMSTSSMPREQFINEDNYEPKCGRGIIKSSPMIHNNSENIYEILPPPWKRQTVKGRIRNDFIKAMGRIKLKKVQTDNGDLNLLRTCSKKEKGFWSLIKNNCRLTNRGVMAPIITANNENSDQSSFLNKTRQYCPCDVKKCNENHSVIKIELSPYIYPFGEDENGNTKRLLYNNKNVKVTIGRVKVQNMWQLKYFKNFLGKSSFNKLPSRTISIKRTRSLITEQTRKTDYHRKINSQENYESNSDRKKGINLTHDRLKNEPMPLEIREKNYFLRQISQSAVDLKRLPPTTSSNITPVSELSSNNSLLKQYELRENFLPKFSWPYNLTKSIMCLNSIYPAVYFKTKAKLKCKNHIRLIPLGRSSSFLNAKSFAGIEVDGDKTLPTNNDIIKEKHITTNVFVISTNTKEYRNLDQIYYSNCNNQYKKNHLQERRTFTSVNAQSSKFRETNYISDVIQNQSYGPSNIYAVHNIKERKLTNFELDGIDSRSTLVFNCNAKFENCFHVLETITGVQRECCIINQATEKHIRFHCPDESIRENRGYTELSGANRRTRHATCIRDDDSEYSKYRVLDPVLSLENSISKFKNRIETTLKKCRDNKKKRQTSPLESNSNENLNLNDSSELRNKGILKQQQKFLHREISPADVRNKGILKMNEYGDRNENREVSPTWVRNKSILKPHEMNIKKMDSQTSPIEIGNRGIVKLPKQIVKKVHCIPPPQEPPNMDIVKQQDHNIKTRYVVPTSPPEPKNRGIIKAYKRNKKNVDRSELKCRDTTKLHEMDDDKRGYRTSPLDIPNRGKVKKQVRDISKNNSQTSPGIRDKDIEKGQRRHNKTRDSKTSPIELRDTAKIQERKVKLTDSQTSPLRLNKEISKKREQDIKKKDSQTSPIDLRNHIKKKDSETSPINLTKRDPVMILKDDFKKRDSQTSPIDLTKKDVNKLHNTDMAKRDSQTSPLNLASHPSCVLKLPKKDIDKIDSQTSPFNLVDGREKPLRQKPEDFQYRPKDKYDDLSEPKRNDCLYSPKAKCDEPLGLERNDYYNQPKAKCEESYIPERKVRYDDNSNEPERNDCQYLSKAKCPRTLEPERSDYQYRPKARFEEPLESERNDHRYRPKAQFEEPLESERKDFQSRPKVRYDDSNEPERNHCQYLSKAKCPRTLEPERNDYQYRPKARFEESLESERNDYQYRPKPKIEESLEPERKDYQSRLKVRYDDSHEPECNDRQYLPKAKCPESSEPESNEYQYRPKTKFEESFESESNEYQYRPKAKFEESLEPERCQYWPKAKFEELFEPERDDFCQYWPKVKFEEPLEREPKHVQHRPTTKCDESMKDDRNDCQYRLRTKYDESSVSDRNDDEYRPTAKFEETLGPEHRDNQYRPKIASDRICEPERNNYQNPKAQHEKRAMIDPDEMSKFYGDSSSSDDEADREDEENRFWPKPKDPGCDNSEFRPYEERDASSFGRQYADYSSRPRTKCRDPFVSKCEDFRPRKSDALSAPMPLSLHLDYHTSYITATGDKERSIVECFRRASRRRVYGQQEQCEEKRKISNYLKQNNNKRKYRGRRFRWRCIGSEDNILTNLVKRSKCHFERIACNPRPVCQKPRLVGPPSPRIVGCRKTIDYQPIQPKKKQTSYDKVECKSNIKKQELTYSDFKVFTNDELKWIISNCSMTVPKNIESSSCDTDRDQMTSEEETMFYCDYASMFNKEPPSDDGCDWEGIRFQVRPNKCASKKWWCIFRTIF